MRSSMQVKYISTLGAAAPEAIAGHVFTYNKIYHVIDLGLEPDSRRMRMVLCDDTHKVVASEIMLFDTDFAANWQMDNVCVEKPDAKQDIDVY